MQTSRPRRPIALALLTSLLACATGACVRPRAPLSLQRVVLYRNGTAYFEHEGRLVDGRLRLALAPGEIDDVLKTLTVLDRGGGRVSVAVEVERAARGKARDLVLHVSGKPSAELQLAYATSAPLWKPSYRLVLGSGAGGKALLQGWAMITNASAQDWRDVRLTLATASPVSYAVDLSTPERVARPRLRSTPQWVGLSGLRMGPSSVDRDGDGIPDAYDKRPDEPETRNGFADQDGAPDRGPVVLRRARIRILEKLYFRRASAQLAASSDAVLAVIARTLRAHPRLREVVIEGHADGDENDPWALSSARAAAVQAALRQRGVKQAVRIVGYGTTRPLDARRTASARARNRRVELRLQRALAPSGALSAKALASSLTTPSTARPRAGAVRYELAAPTSLRSGHSALVTLLHARVEGHEVLLVRPKDAAELRPTRAAWLKNESDGLEAGPVAIFSGGTYVGDGALRRLAPGERALLPFAVEHGSRVFVARRHRRVAGRIVGLAAGQLTVEDELIAETDYRLACGRLAPERAIVEHRLRAGYVAQALPPGSTRAGSGVVFLQLPLRPGQTTRFTQREARADRRVFALAQELDPELLASYLRRSKLPAALATELQQVVAVQRERQRLARELSRITTEPPLLTRQSAELRKNLAALGKLPESLPLRRTLVAQLRALIERLRRAIVAESEARRRRTTLQQKLEQLARRLTYPAYPAPRQTS